MTDADPRIAEWSRADVPEGSPARASAAVWRGKDRLPEWPLIHEPGRRHWARVAVAAIDAYLAEAETRHARRYPQP